MKVSYDQKVDSAPADVFGVLTDEEFLNSYASVATVAHTVAVHQADGVITTRVSRTLPTAQMPAVARRFVGPTIELVEIVSWSQTGENAWHGDVAVDIALHGREAKFRGRTSLEPSGTGTGYALTGDVTIKVPLVGGTVEKLAGDALVRAAGAQLAAAQQRLTGS